MSFDEVVGTNEVEIFATVGTIDVLLAIVGTSDEVWFPTEGANVNAVLATVGTIDDITGARLDMTGGSVLPGGSVGTDALAGGIVGTTPSIGGRVGRTGGDVSLAPVGT